MNEYHIYDKIGKGKYSTVYKGRRKKTISYYAIKSVDKSQKARVLQEVRTMHALDHKNILRFFAWYETSNHLWLILEYCVGGDLMSLLRQDVRLPESSVHDFGRDLVVALQYLHHHSIIYCDLKPSNILLDENGRLKLGGFGLSRRLADINKTPLQALPPAKRGTPCYMAPELFAEGATHSSASDLWSVGCVLYEAAMGRPPFLNSSFNQLVHEILHNDPAPIPGASREFADLITRMLDKNPATRIGWKVKLSWLELPAEPQLAAFIAANNLAPATNDVRASMASQSAARSMRESVDVTRLSRIVLSNLEKEGDGADYEAAEAGAGDIRIESADAELDFDEQRDDGAGEEEEPPSPAQSDDGALVDQSAPAGEAGRVAALGVRSSVAELGGKGRPRASDHSMRPSATGAEDSVGALAGGAQPRGGDADGGADLSTGALDAAAAPAVEALIWHSSDGAVKPIVANRRIERLPEPKYEAKALPFTPLTLQEMLVAEQKDLENFLTDIYRAIASAAPLKDKVNVLSYFETLCVDTGSANVLVNSSLTILFIRMLRNARAPTLRIRLASVLGLLIRHATYIADELSQTGVVEILTEALKDRNERVRRRVMATLGELLFYVATQQDAAEGVTSQQAADAWGINQSTIFAVSRLLKGQEDEVAQHYAIKTIENISSQGSDWAARFASQEVAGNLVAIYSAAKNENIKATAASTIARLLRASPALLAYVVDKFGIRLFIAGLQDPSSKVQTAAVNMLNLALSQADVKARVKSALGEDRTLVPALMALLDHSLLLLRAKALIAILLLCRLSSRWLLELCKAKLIPLVDRLAREKDEYLAAAVGVARTELSRLVPAICAQVGEELARAGAPVRGGAPNISPGRPTSSKNPLAQFQVVLHLLTSPYFRSTTLTPALLSDIAAFITASSAPPSAPPAGLPEFRASLQHVIEAICQQSELVLLHYEPLAATLLPALCTVVGSPAETGDMRFFCLRMVSEVTQLLLLDTELYGAPGPDGKAGGTGIASAAIDTLMTRHVLPMVPQLLSEDDPMPLYALKLLGGLLEVNPGFVHAVEAIGLAPRFFEFLSLEHSNNNVHNTRLCRQIIAAGSLTIEQLAAMGVAEKVAAVLEYATQNSVEPFLEPVLDLCHTIVARDAAETESGRSDGPLMAVLLQQSGIFLELCGQPDPAVACAAGRCLLDMVSLYPLQCAPWLLASESLAVLVTVLQGEHLEEGSGQLPPQLELQLLEAVALCVAVEGAVQEGTPETRQLVAALKHLATSAADAAAKTKAAEALTTLSSLIN